MRENCYRLAVYTEADDGSPLVLGIGGSELTWTREEFASVERDLATVLGFGINETFDTLAAAQRGYHNAVARCLESERVRGNSREPMMDALVCLHAFLTSMRAFLDQSDRRLTNEFGSQSEQRSSFKRATSRVYDQDPAYRFMSWLRNHTQHHDVPLAEISMSESLSRDAFGGEAVVHAVTFACEREALRTACSKRIVSEWLARQPETFEVGPLIDATLECLIELRRAFDSQMAGLVPPAMRRLEEVLAPAVAISGKPTFMEISFDGEPHPVNLRPVDYDRLKTMSASAALLIRWRDESAPK